MAAAKPATAAADELDRFARMVEGIPAAVETLRKVGKIDTAIAEREAKLRRLNDELAAKTKILEDKEAKADEEVTAAWRNVEAAKAEAKRIVDEANDTAARIAAAAKKAADDARADREAQMKQAEADHQKRLAAIQAKANDAASDLADKTEKLQQLAVEEQKINQTITAAKQQMSKLIKDMA